MRLVVLKVEERLANKTNARREQNGLPAVAIRDLLKAALRHRPDRIVLGEIRGGEACDLPQLLHTGHAGALPATM